MSQLPRRNESYLTFVWNCKKKTGSNFVNCAPLDSFYHKTKHLKWVCFNSRRQAARCFFLALRPLPLAYAGRLHKGSPTHCPFLRRERLDLVTPPVRCPPIVQRLSSHRSRKSINRMLAPPRPGPGRRRSFALLASCFYCETHTFVVQSGINELAFARVPLLTSNLLFHARSLRRR